MPNHYDDPDFFAAYAQMPRSRDGLEAAGEWHQLQPLFPPLTGASVLDLGCGYGWHCRYAVQQGAASALGIDLSEKMLDEARRRTDDSRIAYRACGIAEYEYPPEAFDLVVSNLALHYIDDLDAVYRSVHTTLKPGGRFLMNIEHPTFTAGVHEEWIRDEEGRPLYWPVDDYYRPGRRVTDFLGHEIVKYHHTLSQILGGLLRQGFALEVVDEAQPSAEALRSPGMADELRRPMMLLVRARKL